MDKKRINATIHPLPTRSTTVWEISRVVIWEEIGSGGGGKKTGG